MGEGTENKRMPVVVMEIVISHGSLMISRTAVERARRIKILRQVLTREARRGGCKQETKTYDLN